MRQRQWDTILFDLAEDQAGYFTAAQARTAGLQQVRLAQLHLRGDIERVSRGVYRLTRYPVSPNGQYMEAALWPQVRRPDAHGVISHESALALYGLSNVSPAKVHVTVPTVFRIRRTVPRNLILHYADLEPESIQRVDGIPVTTPAQAIRDVHAGHLGAALVRQAIADGRRSGHLPRAQADRLERELLGIAPRRPRVLSRKKAR